MAIDQIEETVKYNIYAKQNNDFRIFIQLIDDVFSQPIDTTYWIGNIEIRPYFGSSTSVITFSDKDGSIVFGMGENSNVIKITFSAKKLISIPPMEHGYYDFVVNTGEEFDTIMEGNFILKFGNTKNLPLFRER